MNNKGSGLTPAQALDKLDALYEQSVVALRNAIGNYITSGELPDENARKQGLFVYPSLTVTWDGSTTNPPKTRAFGRFTHAGSYTTTITRPTLFRSYLNEQLTLLYQDYGAHISVQPSQHEIPYPYVIDGSELTLDRSMSAGLTRYFPTTELAQIGDETADGIYHPTEFSRYRILMRAASIFPSRGCAIIPVRQLNIFSRSSCLPTTHVMWMNSFVGDAARSSILIVPTLPFLVLAGTGSPPKPKRQKKHFRPCMEKTSDASMAFNYRQWSGYYSGEYWRGTVKC